MKKRKEKERRRILARQRRPNTKRKFLSSTAASTHFSTTDLCGEWPVANESERNAERGQIPARQGNKNEIISLPAMLTFTHFFNDDFGRREVATWQRRIEK
jgi:hypothetical protein